MSLVLTIGKHVTGVYGAKGGKKCTRYQARENMHLVPRGGGGGETCTRCQARENIHTMPVADCGKKLRKPSHWFSFVSDWFKDNGRFPFDQKFRNKISSIPCDEWNSIFRLV